MEGKLYVGGPVVFVDPVGKQFPALVTAIWGKPEDLPLVNAVYCSGDENRQDSYGRQIERSTSVSYKDKVGGVHGFYWMFPGETPNPGIQPQV